MIVYQQMRFFRLSLISYIGRPRPLNRAVPTFTQHTHKHTDKVTTTVVLMDQIIQADFLRSKTFPISDRSSYLAKIEQ